MEETVAERPASQEVQINQQQTWNNGSGHRPVCRDFTRGQCFRGRFCKYQHCLFGEYERSAMCHGFIRGNCSYGESCKYRHSECHKHEGNRSYGDEGNRSYGDENFGNFANFGKPRFGEVNKDDNLKSSLPREHRSTAPCWSFPSGRCFRGANCAYSHSENTTPRNNETSHHQDVAQHSVYPVFNNGCVDVALSTSQENNEFNKDLRYHSIHREPRSTSPCRKFLRGSCLRGSSCPYVHPNIDDKPKSDCSTEHHQGRRRTHGEFGNDKQIKEFCLKFAKGRCDRGDSCRYLHSFHEYHAKSGPEARKEHPDNVAALGNSDEARSHVENGSCLNSVSQDVALDEQSKRLSVDNSFNQNVPDQKGEPQVIEQKGEADGEISLWSQPFKRRRTWSESPFAHRDHFSCRSTGRDGYQNSFMKDRNYNLVPFQYRHRGSYHHTWFRCNLDNQPHPTITTTSIDLPSSQVNKDSSIEIPNHNSEYKLAEGDVELSIAEKGDNLCSDSNNSILHQEIDISKGQIGVCPKQVEFQSTSPCECDTSLRKNDGEVSINPVMENGIPASQLKFKGKLLILDVNGILADIVADYPEEFKPDTVVSMKGVFKRPFCDEFLDFCFERFDVGVWSSRNKKNVDKVTDFLLGDSKKKLLFCWDQSYCTDTGYKTVENRDKPLVLKELRRLWEKQVDGLPWEDGYYNVTNTILLDDSPYKALRNPPYTAVFPFPFTFRDSRDTDLGPDGKLRLYLEALSKAENVQKFIEENPFGQRPITRSNLSWHFYSRIVEDY